MFFEGIAGDDRARYPLGYEGQSILRIDLRTPFDLCSYQCRVDSVEHFRAKNWRSPDGGIDASSYELTRITLTNELYSETYKYAFLSDRIRPITGMNFIMAKGRKSHELVAMIGNDLTIFNNNLKRSLRKELGLFRYFANFAYSYSFVVSECARKYYTSANLIVAVNDDRNFEAMLRWMEPSQGM